MDATEGVGVVVLDDVVKSERAQGDDDKDDGAEEVDKEEDNIVVVGVNVKGGGLGGASCSENVVVIMPIPAGSDPHEFLLPFLFF
jgi:hypothetical protein